MGSRTLNWIIRHRAPALILLDIFALQVALFLTWSLRFETDLFRDPLSPGFSIISWNYLLSSLVTVLYWLIVFSLRGIYSKKTSISRYEAFIEITKSVFLGLIIIFIVTWTENPFTSSRLILLSYGILVILATGSAHALFRTWIRTIYQRRIGQFRSIIAGYGPRGQALLNQLNDSPEFGHSVEAVAGLPHEELPTDTPSLFISELTEFIDQNPELEFILIAMEPEDRDKAVEIIEIAHWRGLRVMIVPDFFQILVGMAKSRELYGVPLLEVFLAPMSLAQRLLKRSTDIMVSLTVLTLGLPLLLALGVLIKLSSPGPALYWQHRVGFRGREFKLYKFRSMYQDAEDKSGAVWASLDDPRITPLGRIMRISRLDELPQAWNVLTGTMSLVGPRPERRVFVDKFVEAIPFYNRRHNVKPGITGWAQVRRGYDLSEEDVREKLQYDLFYLENMSIGLDIKILMHTLIVVLSAKGH
ncbi:MAG TPA: sugar transferase [Bacteroidetes bacterium]|nr:sugar transferase [Bacteroidota bacterium]HEX05483.1 sugar transferase [Bacteroidota bacterium]